MQGNEKNLLPSGMQDSNRLSIFHKMPSAGSPTYMVRRNASLCPSQITSGRQDSVQIFIWQDTHLAAKRKLVREIPKTSSVHFHLYLMTFQVQ